MAQQFDVIICGSGSAGLCAALWLARCGISFKILERRNGPLRMGQADGVQCRTVEIFESFGLVEDLLKESYHVHEIAFWSPGPDGFIKRTHFAPDTEPGISHQPHVILNQARINSIMMDEIQRIAGETVIAYNYEVRGVEIDDMSAEDSEAYCTTVEAVKDGVMERFRAKYVLGCDGAHSAVRKSLSFRMIGDSTDSFWGVMDIYPRTNFPDIRKKVILQASLGSLLIIPREGDYMTRFYLELHDITDSSQVKLEMLQSQARRILQPYKIDFVETVWWSAYAIGQRHADHFAKNHRIFLTGDACHTHSPKAGQGMNVSLQDGYNIGWKLAAVLRGQASANLLETYVSERQKTAVDLIEFDRNLTRLFSSEYRRQNNIPQDYLKEQFIKSGRYMAGQTVKYDASLLISPSEDATRISSGLSVGMRLPSMQLVRFCDARPMQLIRALPADSRWHLVVFAGDIRDDGRAAALDKLAQGLERIVREFRGGDGHDLFNLVLILSGQRTDINPEQISPVFTPSRTRWRIPYLQGVFVDEPGEGSKCNAYAAYGVDPECGALVVVRPDHYVSKICSFEGVDILLEFFSEFLRPSAGSARLL